VVISFDERAACLVEAIPYIRSFSGKTFVVKYGGNAMINEELKRAVALDLVLMKCIGLHPIVVHGGGPEITQMMNRMGKEARFVSGLRVTDEETMEIVQMVLVGKVNKDIVSLVNTLGGKAVGLSGQDGSVITARRRPPERVVDRKTGEEQLVDLGHVGDVDRIEPTILQHLSDTGYIPVVSSVGVGPDGESYNINADFVAGEIARTLEAEKLLMLTDVEGLFEDYSDKSTLISTTTVDSVRTMLAQGRVEGGMIPKVQACINAIEGGVARAHIIDGRRPHSILLEMFTDAGLGTMILPEGAGRDA
jgi:acetylglutamate kinase